MQIKYVFLSNNISKTSSGMDNFESMTPVINYLNAILPDDSLISATVDYKDGDVDYTDVDVRLGRIDGRLILSISKDNTLLPHPEATFVPFINEDGEPDLQIGFPPATLETLPMEKAQKYYEEHLEFVQVMLGHFAWFAELNSKDELKEFIETKRVYH